ncbi:pimeloyl-ACP methyl ester carboxylesterase [Rhodococcus erythropolis]|uniref:alpha/beta fold hydrolase n=1 Tax=Rhodococcus erythropolis TaxID=1833 RepID=UPI00216A0F8F|nr:alpha/beta fold hydrolase [Rhodococcus erythropolis]MCS4253062.1 pimeloyl-ACP methyl ester carboxylesterase [Rhodococcus erythropolis]MCW2428492.1 pimeloyl-ACP methyl ester carboxylesterase [Rhodococcus erythropolis]
MTGTPTLVAQPSIRGIDIGSGPTVVLVHGFSLDHRMWHSQIEALGSGFRVVAYDLRGFGQSGPGDGYASHLDDLIALLDALHIDKAHLVGLSLGANVVLAAAASRPDRVSSLALISPGLPGFTWTAPRPPDEAATHARQHGIASAKIFWIEHELFASLESHPAARRQVRTMIEEFEGAQWEGRSMAAPLPDIHVRLEFITAPTVVINGDRDVQGYREIGEFLVRTLPNARGVILEGGHMVSMERCDDVNAELKTHFSSAGA